MNVWLTHLGHALPGPALAQSDITDWLARRLVPGSDADRFRRFAARSGVSARHSVVDLFGGEGDRLYPSGAPHADAGARSRLFAERALPLAVAAVRDACPGELPAITHVVVATCTGAVAPGLDLQLIDALGLSRSVRRIMVGLMGCYAAVPALRAAWDACRADPQAVVLVVCCELSSLHLQPGPDDDALLGACLFGDGAAAAIVRSAPRPLGLGLSIVRDACAVVPDTAGHMAWQACATGFSLRLSPAVSRSLALDLGPVVDRLLGDQPRASTRWTVHPGGPRILDDVERHLSLPAGTLDASRAALAAAGNRSSGTVLSILRDQTASHWSGPLALLAFGPGLTAEGLFFERHL